MTSSSPSSPWSPPAGVSLAWLLLGLFALFLSGLFAIVLVVLRTPFLSQWLGNALPFRSALVLHVDLAVAVWFLSMAGFFWSWLQRESLWSWLAWGVATSGVLTMLVSPLAESGVAVINNYLPVIHAPLFLGGLAFFVVGVAGSAALALWPGNDRESTPLAWPLRAAALVTFAALLVTGKTWLNLPQQWSVDSHWFETLFWGGGHLLQFVHTLLLIAAWWVLLRPGRESWFRWSTLLAVVPVLVALPLSWGLAVDSPDYRAFYTDLMAYGSWLWLFPTLPLLVREGKGKGVVWASAVLFVLGIGVGVAIRADNLVVTAHYHGTVGGITLAFMGVVLHLLRPQRTDGIKVYGSGLLLLILGLLWAGLGGAPRKSIFSHLPESTWDTLLPLLLVGVGGLTALVGLFLFLLPSLAALLERLNLGQRAPMWQGGLAIVLVGVVLQWFPAHPVASLPTPTVAQPQPQEDPELRLRFQQGAMMLHAGEYEHAVVAFHEVLSKNPRLPEAHLNMGYAMLGLQRYEAARDFFLGAVDLRPAQANAYFGLAEAYEALEDLPAALGAMRTFIHMTHNKDPFLVRARAAVWEWEKSLKEPKGPVKLPDKH
ncbi:MAG: tetratricopeptide repeat protein [Magnetococcales bacterium]|nr:tetratricopeptide repeat protein [Magnetococcales bacterium]